jgi:integrase
MSRSHLALVPKITVISEPISFAEKLADHERILDSYFNTFITRNLSDSTSYGAQSFIKKWFGNFVVPDLTHQNGERQLLVWEAMEPGRGRQLIIGYSNGLCQLGLAPRTVNGYLGLLRRFFDYVCSYPYIPGVTLQPITFKYGGIEQPVLEFDYPIHTLDHELAGPALTGKRLNDFYDYIRLDYIRYAKKKKAAQRTYTMIVFGGESGCRANELRHLNAHGSYRDLFYEDGFIQVRWGKASNGSGKRNRKTIFTPLAQDTGRAYEEHVRPFFLNGKDDDALFLAENGNRISYDAMYLGLRSIVEGARRAGLELPDKVGWHDLRRAFATNFMEKHPDQIGLLLQMMGHTSLGVIYRYVLHSQAYYEKAMSRVIERLMGTLGGE